MLLCVVTSVSAESVITVTTSKAYGDTFVFNPVPLEAGKISVDWGDGELVEYDVNPSDMPYLLRKEGVLKGNTVKIYGVLTEITFYEQGVTGLTLEGQSALKKLSANKNQLTYATLDLGDATNLEMLQLGDNNIHMLNLRNFSKLEYLDLYNNPELGTVAFADSNPNMKMITMNNCDIVHFYDTYSFPQLTSLNLSNNSLWDITFDPAHYPALRSLNLANNQISELDVTGLTTLEDLSVSGNKLTELNVAANTQLTGLAVNNNEIEKLNLSNNTKLTSLNVSNTKLTKLDVSKMASLRSLYCDSLHINRLEVSGLKWLQTLSAKDCDLEFLDFTANYFMLRYLYLQGNENFTPQSLNFMYQTISDPDRTGRIYVEGCNGETADAEKYLMQYSADTHWIIDVEGDGSCSMSDVVLTQQPTTGGTYKVMKRDMTWSADRDAFSRYYDEVGSDGKVVPGSILCVRYEAEEGKEYKGIMVNGTLVQDTLFVVTADADVQAVFGDVGGEKCITLTVPAGQVSAYALGADSNNTTVNIDWGDGELKPYTINGNTWTWIDGTTEGTQVKIYGDVTYLNCESYPDYATDNQISAIDLSQNNSLKYLDLYFNQLTSIDLSNEPELLYLDVSMNEELDNVDVSQCPKLVQLRAYGLEWLEEIDITNNPMLQYVDLKNTFLEEIDLTNNNEMVYLNVSNALLDEINVENMPQLQQLYLNGNILNNINVSNNTNLLALSVGGNKLNQLDLSNNTLLEKLDAADNTLAALDLSKNTRLWYIDVRGNGWDACQTNDFFYSLPEYVDPGEEVAGSTTQTKLWVALGSNANDVEHSETLIAKSKLWVMNYTGNGDGTGCNEAYITILPYSNGAVTVMDAENNVVETGAKVQKNSEITVMATPDAGYAVSSMKANGENISNNKFTITRATDIAVKFALSTAINGVQQVTATAEGGKHEVNIFTNNEVKVTILGANGKVLFSEILSSDTTVSLPAGIYVVTMQSGSDTATRKLLVK